MSLRRGLSENLKKLLAVSARLYGHMVNDSAPWRKEYLQDLTNYRSSEWPSCDLPSGSSDPEDSGS